MIKKNQKWKFKYLLQGQPKSSSEQRLTRGSVYVIEISPLQNQWHIKKEYYVLPF